ncbi:hypothetical protein D3C72_2467710 [compost metagenome]
MLITLNDVADRLGRIGVPEQGSGLLVGEGMAVAVDQVGGDGLAVELQGYEFGFHELSLSKRKTPARGEGHSP